MKKGDLAKTPQIDFTGTKAAIEATVSPIEGMTALATDNPSAPIGKYLGGAWVWFGGTSGLTNPVDYIDFNTAGAANPETQGRLSWNVDEATLDLGMGNDITGQLCHELFFDAKNQTGSDIINGTPVMFAGTLGASGRVKIQPAIADGTLLSEYMMGLVTHDIDNGDDGKVTWFGKVRGIDTSGGLSYGAAETWADGDLLWVSQSHAGYLTNVEPIGGQKILAAAVIYAHNNGTLLVRPTWGDETILDIHSAMQDPTGFPNRTDSTWSITGDTLTIVPAVTSYDIWFDGVKHTISASKDITLADTEGIHLIYFDTDDTLKEYVNPTTADVLAYIRDKCAVALVYWDATNNEAVYVGEERHGTVMDGISHYYLHYTRGLQYVSGLGLGDFVIGDGSLDSHAQFSVAEGSVADEDIGLTIDEIESTTGLPILYMLGANSYWRSLAQAGFSCYQNPTGTTHRLMYNQYTSGAWQLTEVGEGDYVLYHIFASTGKTLPIYSIMGQAEYTTLPAARAGAQVEISSLILGSLPSVEMRPIATVIFQTDKDYGNSINARVVEVESGGDDYVDWRSSELPRGVAPTSHNNLTDLQLAANGVTYGHIDDQAQTLTGVKTFASFPVTPSSAPTTDYQTSNKKYSDDGDTSAKDLANATNPTAASAAFIEAAQDAVGAMVDSTLTYTDPTPALGLSQTIKDGLIPVSGLSYSSADSPTFVISTDADLSGIIGVGDRLRLVQTTVKWFIVTAIASNTITVYGGADYTLANAEITTAHYSHDKSPYGFPTSPEKWTQEIRSTSGFSQATPTTNTWYNITSLSLPIGAWRCSYQTTAGVSNASGYVGNAYITLSTANNSQSDVDWTSTGQMSATGSSAMYLYAPCYREKLITVASKTTYYLNIRTISSASALFDDGARATTIIRAVCAYL